MKGVRELPHTRTYEFEGEKDFDYPGAFALAAKWLKKHEPSSVLSVDVSLSSEDNVTVALTVEF